MLVRRSECSEVVGKLVDVSRDEVVIEATRRFEIAVDEETARAVRGAIGREVGVLYIEGKTRWRLVKASP